MDPWLLTFVEVASAFAAGVVVGGLAVHHASKSAKATEAETAAVEEVASEPEPVAATEELPAPKPQPRPATKLGVRLFSSLDPVREMRAWLTEVRRREERDSTDAPDVLELFLARRLEEAGLADERFSLPGLRVVRPHTSGMFYLRLPKGETTFGETLAMYTLEAALNAGVLAEEIFSLRPPKDECEIYAALDTLSQRITAQVSNLHAPEREGDGEWGARLALSHAIECLRLPYRLNTSFRMNLAEGVAAIEFEVTPEEVFPGSALVADAGIVPTTPDMRLRARTDYSMRLVVLLAECAFAASERLSHVWVAAIERTPESHACLISAALDREAIEGFANDPVADVESLLACTDTHIKLEDGKLMPCSQNFSLDEERFCPPSRYEPVGLSARKLTPEEAEALGTPFVRGLEIDEAALREQLAENVAKRISPDGQSSCEEAVRAVLELSHETSDETLRHSATRTAQRLVEGTLEPEPLAVIEALCDDDGLVEAVTSAQNLLVGGRHEEAAEVVTRALAPIDAAGAYRDSATDEWRAFSNYVDRVLYNLTFSREGVETHLVPETYVEAVLTRSMALLVSGHGDEAVTLARRAAAICPMSSIVRLHLIQCLDFIGSSEEARLQLIMLLSQAHDPEGLGFGYYRMAMVLFQEGKVTAARAAYQRALAFMPSEAAEAFRTMGAMMIFPNVAISGELPSKEVERVLAAEGIPFAPTKEVTQAFMKAARASLDAEIFPVARDFMRVLGTISKDDVLFGVFRSLEDEPDR